MGRTDEYENLPCTDIRLRAQEALDDPATKRRRRFHDLACILRKHQDRGESCIEQPESGTLKNWESFRVFQWLSHEIWASTSTWSTDGLHV